MYFFRPFIICKSLKFQTVLQGGKCERDPGGNKELLEESQIYQSGHLQSAMKDITARHVAPIHCSQGEKLCKSLL